MTPRVILSQGGTEFWRALAALDHELPIMAADAEAMNFRRETTVITILLGQLQDTHQFKPLHFEFHHKLMVDDDYSELSHSFRENAPEGLGVYFVALSSYELPITLVWRS